PPLFSYKTIADVTATDIFLSDEDFNCLLFPFLSNLWRLIIYIYIYIYIYILYIRLYLNKWYNRLYLIISLALINYKPKA
ncbi:MAG: hypothetical protein N7Q72_01370, partial [Spiroplasma sp. Tabriz.8]|nr:hypothetical protein [Spiroplasma sp. Tabriz.8]